ncbi:MAG: hypothetical protein M2R45_00693 [Verrucomicrobia subdivision 3 bacterium]|nr:hypothetical protein [Limisphaerales bacterium]MCS1414423.1 hypothetical protein [Limisphaerales bacterium]
MRARWGDEPRCPHCASGKAARKADNLRIGRWTCHVCKSSFNVLAGTLFKKTRVPLQRWFMAMGIPINAKKSLSRHQLARDLGLTQPAALRLQRRIRASRSGEAAPVLQGIAEADETYVGGKPRKGSSPKSSATNTPSLPPRRGRGIRKTPVIGAVERGGRGCRPALPSPCPARAFSAPWC